jgi:alkylation response protein AidB-like acyl-CoA dehydrogenase
LILNLELARCGCRGYVDGFLAGGVIGLPPVINFGSDEIKAQVVPEVLAGKKFICLAISEAFAGSDVGGLQTTAVRDGDCWVISGTKKYGFCHDPVLYDSQTEPRLRWITNGTFADYFTVACRTEVGVLCLFASRSEGSSGKIHRYPRPKGRKCRDKSDQDGLLIHCWNRLRDI